MKSNVFDWARMSPDHQRVAEMHYPLISQLAESSDDYAQFARRVRSLDIARLQQYQAEWAAWNSSHGGEWLRGGGLVENRVGGGRAIRFLKMDMGAIGASSDFPADYSKMLSNGWSGCNQPPPGAVKDFSGKPYPADSSWNYSGYHDPHDPYLVYFFLQRKTGTDQFWYYPPGVSCGTNTSSSKVNSVPMVKDIQKALLAKGYNPGKIDGIWGPNTCKAAYTYKQEVLGDWGVLLGKNFYAGLGLPEAYWIHFETKCTPWFQNFAAKPGEPIVTTPEPKPAPKPTPISEPDPEPAPKKAGMGLIMGIIGLGVLVGGIFVAGRGKKKGKK